MLTHTLSTEYTAIFTIIYLILNFSKLKDKEIIKKLMINAIFIVTISAFFIIPLIEYKKHSEYLIFSNDAMISTGADVSETTINFKQLFKDESEDGVSFTLGGTFVLLMLLGIVTYRKMRQEDKSQYLNYFIIAIISLFMVTKLFPWLIMPNFITNLQFAWRLLAFFEFAMAICCGYNLVTLMDILNNKKFSKNAMILIFLILIISTMVKINYNYKYEKDYYTDEEYEHEIKENHIISPWAINRDYLPSKAEENLRKYNKNNTTISVIEGNADIESQNKENLEYSCEIKSASKDTILELPFYNYPGYNIVLQNGDEKIKLEYFESAYGYISIIIPKDIERATLNVKYTGTAIEKISYIISLVSIIVFVIYINLRKKKLKGITDGKV